MKILLELNHRAEWRTWLKTHAASEKEIWLVHHKKSFSAPGIAYEEAVEEAICFGWIDSKVQKLDEARFARRFTPRKPGSRWSAINIARANSLIGQKKMTPAGTAAFHPERQIRPHPTKLPMELQEEFQRNAKAWNNFQQFPASYRRMTIAWVATAKRVETQRKRLVRLIELSSKSERIKFM